MARIDEGLRSEELRKALVAALGGDEDALVALLGRMGGLPGPHPNVRLAAAFAEEVAATEPAAALRLSLRMARSETSEDAPEAFLAVAGAFGLCALNRRLEREPRELDGALLGLAADERRAVRVGTVAALTADAARAGGADAFVRRATGWLDEEDREARYSACASALDVLSDPHVMSEASEGEAVLAYLDRAIHEIVEAPRAAERAPARRRMLAALATALPVVVPAFREGPAWLVVHCERATHEDLRAALSKANDRLRKAKISKNELAALHDALVASKKPPRDPTRDNEDARGRGRKRKRRRG